MGFSCCFLVFLSDVCLLSVEGALFTTVVPDVVDIVIRGDRTFLAGA